MPLLLLVPNDNSVVMCNEEPKVAALLPRQTVRNLSYYKGSGNSTGCEYICEGLNIKAFDGGIKGFLQRTYFRNYFRDCSGWSQTLKENRRLHCFFLQQTTVALHYQTVAKINKLTRNRFTSLLRADPKGCSLLIMCVCMYICNKLYWFLIYATGF